MPMVKNVEKKIWDVEGFQVNFLSSVGKNLRDNKKDMPQYPFTRKAPGDMTVSELSGIRRRSFRCSEYACSRTNKIEKC